MMKLPPPAIMLAAAALVAALVALWLSTRKHTAVDMKEFAGLDGQLKNMYRNAVVDIMAPTVVGAINREWRDLPAEKRAELLADSRTRARGTAAMIMMEGRNWFAPPRRIQVPPRMPTPVTTKPLKMPKPA